MKKTIYGNSWVWPSNLFERLMYHNCYDFCVITFISSCIKAPGLVAGLAEERFRAKDAAAGSGSLDADSTFDQRWRKWSSMKLVFSCLFQTSSFWWVLWELTYFSEKEQLILMYRSNNSYPNVQLLQRWRCPKYVWIISSVNSGSDSVHFFKDFPQGPGIHYGHSMGRWTLWRDWDLKSRSCRQRKGSNTFMTTSKRSRHLRNWARSKLNVEAAKKDEILQPPAAFTLILSSFDCGHTLQRQRDGSTT